MKLAIYGKSGVGKDYIAGILMEGHGKCNVAFADPLKESVSKTFDIPLGLFYTQEGKNDTFYSFRDDTIYRRDQLPKIRREIAAEELFSLPENTSKENMFMSLRELIVYMGTYVLREKFNQNFWINRVKTKIDEIYGKEGLVIVTDIRFPREYEFLRSQGFKFLEITGKSNDSVYNVAESYYQDFIPDYKFYNSRSLSYDELKENLDKTLGL